MVPEGTIVFYKGFMIARVYVDGLSLFYGSVKGTPYKWLNVGKLCEKAFPELSVKRIKYFTAKVMAPANDPSKKRRQLYYLRALRTLPNFEPKYGRFYSHYIDLPKAESWRRGVYELVEVLKTEEKQTDVNIASHMVNDSWLYKFEVAVLITNDTDYKTPIDMLKKRGIQIWLLSPTTISGDAPAWLLAKDSDRVKVISQEMLRDCQFPEIMSDRDGPFYKPASW